MQNGTPIEHQYPVIASTFIIYYLNYSEHITIGKIHEKYSFVSHTKTLSGI